MLEPRDEAILAESFGTFIFNLRESKGMTIREAAKAVGISHSRLVNFEHGRDPHTAKPTLPSAELVGKIAAAYGCPMGQLLLIAGYSPWMVGETGAEAILGLVDGHLGKSESR